MTCALRVIFNKWKHVAIGLMAVLFSAHTAQAQVNGSIVVRGDNGSGRDIVPARNGGLVEIATGDAHSQTPSGLPSTAGGCVICPPPPVPVILEFEPCGLNSNQGCPLGSPPPEHIECNRTVCGTFWRSASSIDVDMYQFTLTACTCITWTVDSEALVGLSLNSNTCGNITSVQNGVCHTSLTRCLPPGTYRVAVIPSFNNPVFDCASPLSQYVATLTCDPCPPEPTSVCCEKSVQPFQIIQLLSGQVNGAPGAPGGLDDAVRYSAPGSTPTTCTGGTLNGSYGAGFSLPYTHAVSGTPAKVIAPHPAWLPTLSGVNATGNARWINSAIAPASSPPNQGSPGQSVLYYHPFTVTTARPPKTACITFTWMVDDALGDPVGPHPLGVYLHHGGLNLLNPPAGVTPPPISGGTYNSQTTTTVYLGPGDLALGSNKLFIYQHNVNNNPGCQASGVIYHAQIEICELCNVGDLNCNGAVNLDDLLTVIGNWGACPESCESCPADLNNDCTVNLGDLLIVIANWG